MILLLSSLLFFGMSGAQEMVIPKHILQDAREQPAETVNMRLAFDIFSTSFNFDTQQLDIKSQVVMVWNDPRKAFDAQDADGQNELVFELGIASYQNFDKIIKTMWLPPLKSYLEQNSFREGFRSYEDRITISSSGKINLELMHVMGIPCTQTSSNYPFDTYECWMFFTNLMDKSKITISSPLVRENVTMLMPTFHSFGHRIKEIKEKKSTYVNNFNTNRGPYSGVKLKHDTVVVGIVVERQSARAMAEVVLPTLCIAIADFLLFLFSPSTLSQLSLLPLYTLHFDDLSFTNTVRNRPPIARFFFARLYSSVFCHCLGLIFHLISLRNDNVIFKSMKRFTGRILFLCVSTSLIYLALSLDSYTPPMEDAFGKDEEERWW